MFNHQNLEFTAPGGTQVMGSYC